MSEKFIPIVLGVCGFAFICTICGFLPEIISKPKNFIPNGDTPAVLIKSLIVANEQLNKQESAANGDTAPAIIPDAATQGMVDKNPDPCLHQVEAGQNLFRISANYNLTQEDLARINGITDPSIIKAGQLLIVCN